MTLYVLFGYLVGSIPFAYILARRSAGVDLRMVGSGNVGASNVFRTSGRAAGFIAAVLDIGKGAFVVLCVQPSAGDLARTATGVAAVVGHMYPVWLHFRGGKGVATMSGVFGILSPLATGLTAPVFGVTLLLTGYVSLASMASVTLLPPVLYLTGSPEPVVTGASVAAALVLVRHRSNIARLQAGTERRLGRRV